MAIWDPNDEYYEEQWPEWPTYEADAWAEPVNDPTRSASSTDDTHRSSTPTDATASAVLSYSVTLTAARASGEASPGFILALTDSATYSLVQSYTKQQDRLLFDSGAAVHACPLDYATEYPLCTKGSKPSFRTVT